MNTREHQAIINAGPWILYDGTCNLCSGGANRLGGVARRRGFRLAPLQSAVGLAFRTPRDEMQVITRSGDVVGGLAGFGYICRRIWWAWPLGFVLALPPVRWILNPLYRLLARNRYRISGTCRLRGSNEENPYAVEL